jgi:hypothetical protein
MPMTDAQPIRREGLITTGSEAATTGGGLISWIPLTAGLAAMYGPIAYNYGIALYFLNYRHGFVKRGLVGELVLPLAHLSRGGLAALQIGFILAAFGATYVVLRRLLFGTTQDRMLAAVLLSAPAMLPHLGYLFEQPDVTLYLLLLAALAALLGLPAIAGSLVATALACVALLAHEAFSLAFFPLIAAILWDRCRRKALPWSVAVFEIALVLAAFLAVVHFGRLKVAPSVLLAEAALRTSVPLQRQVFDVMASSFTEQRALVSSFYRGGLMLLYGLTLVLSIPYFYLLAGLLRRAGRSRGYSRIDGVMLTFLFVLPMSLCYLGHDVSRWISACAIDATLFLCYLALSDAAVRGVLRSWATGPRPFVWLSWLLVLGPYGAIGLRAVHQLSVLWTGP